MSCVNSTSTTLGISTLEKAPKITSTATITTNIAVIPMAGANKLLVARTKPTKLFKVSSTVTLKENNFKADWAE